MTNTKVKWHNEDYDLGCDISKLNELGFNREGQISLLDYDYHQTGYGCRKY